MLSVKAYWKEEVRLIQIYYHTLGRSYNLAYLIIIATHLYQIIMKPEYKSLLKPG